MNTVADTLEITITLPDGSVTLRYHVGENLGTMALEDAALLLKELSKLAA